MWFSNLLVIALVSFCAWTDLRTEKIYNKATYPAVLLGLGLSCFGLSLTPLQSLLGGVGAFFLYWVVRYLAGMGAGDVKLMAALGTLKGFPFVLNSSYYILCFACAMGLLLLMQRGRLVLVTRWVALSMVSWMVPGLARPSLASEPTRMPLAPAIALGTLAGLYLEARYGAFTLNW